MTNVSKVACIIIYLIKKNLNKLFVIIPPKNTIIITKTIITIQCIYTSGESIK